MLECKRTGQIDFPPVKKVKPSRETTDYLLLSDWSETCNEAAISELYKRYKDVVYSLSQRMVGRSAAEDVIQEVFLTVSKKAGMFDPHMGNVRSWIIGITIRKCKQFIRKQSRRNANEKSFGRRQSVNNPGEGKNSESIDVLLEALSRLPERYRMALELRYLDGFTVQETAKVFNVKINTMQHRLLRGLEKIRTQMGSYGIIISTASCISRLEGLKSDTFPESYQQDLAQLISSSNDVDPIGNKSYSQSIPAISQKVLLGVAVACMAIVTFNFYPNNSNRESKVSAIPGNFKKAKGDKADNLKNENYTFQYPPYKSWTFEKGIPADLLIRYGHPKINFKWPFHSLFSGNSTSVLSFAGEFSSQPILIKVQVFPDKNKRKWTLGCILADEKMGEYIPSKGIRYENFIKNQVTEFNFYFWKNYRVGVVNGEINGLDVYGQPVHGRKLELVWKDLNIISIKMKEIGMHEIPSEFRNLDDYVKRNEITLYPILAPFVKKK